MNMMSNCCLATLILLCIVPMFPWDWFSRLMSSCSVGRPSCTSGLVSFLVPCWCISVLMLTPLPWWLLFLYMMWMAMYNNYRNMLFFLQICNTLCLWFNNLLGFIIVSFMWLCFISFSRLCLWFNFRLYSNLFSCHHGPFYLTKRHILQCDFLFLVP